MAENDDIIYTDALRITICTTCREAHAMPRLAFMAAVTEQRPVFCHNGHSYTPGDPNHPDSNALLNNFKLSSALADAKAQLVSMGRHLAALAPSDKEPDAREIRRRAQVLTNRAEPGSGYGRKICPFCGHEKGGRLLAEHLRRTHRHLLCEMPAQSFD